MSCENLVLEDKFYELDQFIEHLPDKRGNLIAVLHKAQELFGYLPEDLQLRIADKLNIPSSEVSGVVSFYSFFTTKPRGKHVINVCTGTACYVRGAERLLSELDRQLGLKPGETTKDNNFTLDALRCVGACGLAPVMIVDGKVYGRLKPEQIKGILASYS
ncbi:NADH-quinone oxidoreductase subunit NuoE [Desulfitobacterium sp. Sab5]|uniref:NADH-quinone oxidoreductase subunit NuoE n=1 Tax=Desulfitobacterium TaxID=36853 RepID=UPI003CEFFF3A